MAAGGAALANYETEPVERALLDVTVSLHPTRLTISELTLQIVNDPDDTQEVEAITEAIASLRRFGVFRYRNDDRLIEVTQAGLHVYVLVTELAKLARQSS
jgi:hypothetical protein